LLNTKSNGLYLLIPSIHRLFPADRIFAILATPVSEDKRDRLRRLLDDADFEFEDIRLIYARSLRPGNFVVPDDLEQQVINYRQTREIGRDNDGASRPVEFIDNVEKSTGSQGDDSSLTMTDMSTPERHTAAAAAGTAVNEQDPENPETLLRGMHVNPSAQSNLRALDLEAPGAGAGAVDGSTGGSDGNAAVAPDNEVGLPLSESNSGTVQSNPQNE